MDTPRPRLSPEEHSARLRDVIVPEARLDQVTSQPTPRAIILAGQPGAGKGGLVTAVEFELADDVVKVDPDELRGAHPDARLLRQQHPYTWAGHTHEDASQWAKELRSLAIEGRRNLILDTTLGNGDNAVALIKDLQAKGYDVEIRGVVAHRLESELGVDARFADSLNSAGSGRYVPEDVRRHVYEALPGNLDKVRADTGIQIRLYGREGAQVYDSHSDARLPGAALEAEREARLKDPRVTQTLRDGWRAQGRWHAELADTLPLNDKVSPPTAAAVFDERTTLKVVEGITPNIQEARSIDHTIRVRPNMVRGAMIGGAATTVVEAATEGTKIADLYARDNRTGAEAALLDFGVRSVGGWTGAAVGAKAGTLLGIESGPGAIVTGIIGAGFGAWGASEVVEWIEKYQINNQADSTGRVWTFDPTRPEKGWTHSEREIVGTVGTLADRPIYGATTLLTADADLTQQLNYQASSRAVGLRLSEPDQPINPFSIDGDASDTPSALPRSWERNPENGEWRREVVHQVLEHGIKSTTVEVADTTKAAQLDESAQGIIAFNAARSSAAFAKQYEQAYTAQGWARYGAIPDEVVWARNHSDHVLASDGRTYQRQDDGEWLHDGWIHDSLAEGNIRDELNGTRTQIRAIQQMEAPVPDAHERRPAPSIQSEAIDAAPVPVALHEAKATPAPIQPESDVPASFTAAEPAAPRISEHGLPYSPPPGQTPAVQPSNAMASQEPEALATPLLPTQPEHPDHALYQQVREGVAALDTKHGRTFDEASERMAASLLVLAKDNDLDRVDHVLLSNATTDKPAGHTLFVVQGRPSDPAHHRAAMPTELAAQTSIEESMRLFDAVSREAQQRAIAKQLEQQQEDQRVQHDIRARAVSTG